MINFRPHVVEEMKANNIGHYFNFNKEMDLIDWRTMRPHHLIRTINQLVNRQIPISSNTKHITLE